MNEILKTLYDSPIGKIELTASYDGLKSLLFLENNSSISEDALPVSDIQPGLSEYSEEIVSCLKDSLKQLKEYFAGQRKIFSLRLAPEGTAFQKKVWNELQNISFGETISYLELSRRLGDTKAIRAVGGANGKNRIPIIIPCHRVIGENGKLVGYGGGLWRKHFLLNLEGSLGQLDFGPIV
ncbi:MAG: methylated-DNA--[protein]-cysteine S-methyltransferase [Clostridiales bacterium]